MGSLAWSDTSSIDTIKACKAAFLTRLMLMPVVNKHPESESDEYTQHRVVRLIHCQRLVVKFLWSSQLEKFQGLNSALGRPQVQAATARNPAAGGILPQDWSEI